MYERITTKENYTVKGFDVEDQQFFEDLLSIVLGEDILLKGSPQAEKELRKYVRLDVWAEDQQGEIYNAEVGVRYMNAWEEKEYAI